MKLKQIFSRDMIILVLGQVISLLATPLSALLCRCICCGRPIPHPFSGWLQPVPFCPWWCFPSWAAELRTG
ncbi:MAG: hypothetical protein ACLR1T_04820 [Evtepia gabavorous]